ncbi:MAG: DUF4830 domain-containing protein [Oscillospiraceae bacterium]|nr:DUF4830 domain-containing protein [Oscillospiraceae bacterium]
MFIFTAKVNRSRILAVVGAAVVVCGILTFATNSMRNHDVEASSAAAGTSGIKTNEDRIAFLEHYGWTVSEQPLSVEELQLPDTFDESYSEYLALQSGQGFDLTRYAGKRVKRYTYEVTNYPTGEQGIEAGLLIYKDEVIGGEIFSPKLDGFIHGLSVPA